MFQLALGVKGVVHDHYPPQGKDRVGSDHHLGHVGEYNGDLVPLLEAQIRQGGSEPIHQFIQLPVGDLLPHHDQGHCFGILSRCPFQGFRQGDLFIIDSNGHAFRV